jgi:hypothetical protein
MQKLERWCDFNRGYSQSDGDSLDARDLDPDSRHFFTTVEVAVEG